MRFSPADIEAYARGERSDGRLLESLVLDNPYGRVSIEVGFAPPAGSVTEFQYFGWPTNWLVYRWDGTYEDAYGRQHAIRQPPLRETQWSGLSHLTQRITNDGRRESRMIALRAMVAPVVLLVAAWGTGRLIGGMLCRRRRATRFGARAVALLFVVLTAAVIGLLSLGSTAEVRNIWTSSKPRTASIGLTTAEVARLRDKPDGERDLAFAILPHTAGADPTDVLVIGPAFYEKMQQSATFAGWPSGSLILSRIEPFGSRANDPVVRRFMVYRDSIRLDCTDAKVAAAQLYVSLSMITVFEVIAGLMLVWYVAGWTVRGVAQFQKRSEQRRMARGRCAWCGYHVTVLSPTT